MPRHSRVLCRFPLVLLAAGCGDAGPSTATDADTTTGPTTDPTMSSGPTDPSGPTSPTTTTTANSTADTTADDTSPTSDTTGEPPDPDAPLSEHIVVDQFGYRPNAEKLAVLRSAVTGFDAGTTYTPGASYAVVDAFTNEVVLEVAPAQWNGGADDPSSGDVAWRVDFSAVTEPGDYYVLDTDAQVRSDLFRIADDVYADVLAQSIRMLYYQRDGFPKDARYAGADWADGPAHLGPNQGPQCSLYTGGSPRDLQGGWWDAGDMNKYTNWSANYAIALLRAYRERPVAFRDDYDIPESGNGVADLLDENKFNLDWLVRMQSNDGAVLSIVGQDAAPDPAFGGSPDTSPSLADGPCTYGPATTSASLTTSAAFALAALVYAEHDDVFPGYAADLTGRAEDAWAWADANPNVTFYNAGTIGAGEQETDDHGRTMKRLQAAAYLFELTGDPQYRAAFDADYDQAQLIASDYLDVFALEEHDALLAYASLPDATPAIVDDIRSTFEGGIGSANNLGTLANDPDPYLAFSYVYVWGSNQVKADQGNLLMAAAIHDIAGPAPDDALRAAERYVHYIHGVNPLALVYLTNMEDFGATKSVTQIYHAWFAHGSNWDAQGTSMFGPPPGYLAGGPNPTYAWDGCCPGGCGGGADCGAQMLSPPSGQPPQKSYLDFNESWPINSWSVTEPSNGYQVKYIRLLSKLVSG